MKKKTLKQKISNILAKHDTVKLIALGAPNDEYDSEAKMIYDYVRRGKHRSDTIYMTDKIYSIFARMFFNSYERMPIGGGIIGPKTDYVQLTKDVIKAVKKHNTIIT